jgi:UDP-glucose 4-epimerase
MALLLEFESNKRAILKTILITGAFGFLGSHLCKYFDNLGYHVIALGRHTSPFTFFEKQKSNITSIQLELPSDEFEPILRKYKPNQLIHCAGPASVPASMEDPLNDFQQGVGNWAFVLDKIRRIHPSCHIGFVSSASVYGNPKNLPIKENTPNNPMSPYGYHKYLCEILAKEYSDLFGLNISIFRLFSAFGEGLLKQIVFDLFKKFTSEHINEVELFGNGKESRDFIHGQDVAQAMHLILNSSKSGVFNIGNGTETTIADLADQIKSIVKSSKEIHFNQKIRTGDPRFWKSDITKIKELGYSPTLSLYDGLENTFTWFKKTHHS